MGTGDQAQGNRGRPESLPQEGCLGKGVPVGMALSGARAFLWFSECQYCNTYSLKNEHNVKHCSGFISLLITPTFHGTVTGLWGISATRFGSSQGDLILSLIGQTTTFA